LAWRFKIWISSMISKMDGRNWTNCSWGKILFY
jgi:hypothetical protein